MGSPIRSGRSNSHSSSRCSCRFRSHRCAWAGGCLPRCRFSQNCSSRRTAPIRSITSAHTIRFRSWSVRRSRPPTLQRAFQASHVTRLRDRSSWRHSSITPASCISAAGRFRPTRNTRSPVPGRRLSSLSTPLPRRRRVDGYVARCVRAARRLRCTGVASAAPRLARRSARRKCALDARSDGATVAVKTLALVPLWLALVAGFMLVAALALRLPRLRARFERIEASRIPALDGLRGVLAISVFVHHAYLTRRAAVTGSWGAPDNAFIQALGLGAVAIFFMITAFLFWSRALSAGGRIAPLRLYRARLRRIYPAFAGSIALLLLSPPVRRSSACAKRRGQSPSKSRANSRSASQTERPSTALGTPIRSTPA